MKHEKVVLLSCLSILLFASVLLIASGETDLDWMVVGYKYQIGQATAQAVSWEFSPYVKLNWWLAYQLALYRLMIGCGLLGVALCYISLKLRRSEKVSQ